MYTNVRDELQKTLGEIRSAGLYKQERLLDSPQASHVSSSSRDLLNFCSNNYLGLANHPDIIAAAKASPSLDRTFGGSSSVSNSTSSVCFMLCGVVNAYCLKILGGFTSITQHWEAELFA